MLLTWPLWALLPFCVLLVAALGLLYRRHSRVSRNEANAVLSRDRANFDLQISVHVNRKLQRAFREAQGKGNDSVIHQGQTDDTISLPDSLPSTVHSALPSRRFAFLKNGGAPPASLPAGPPSSAAGRSAADQEELPNVPLSWAAAARKWRAERASVAGSGVALQAPIPSAAPAACTSAADYQQAARLPWAVPAGFTAPLKKASTKRAAPPSSASAPSAKRAFTSPYNEFCKEQRPLLPAKTNNKDREKLLGELAP